MANKLDPKQSFIISSMTREEVAESVNGIIDAEGWGVPKFEHDDERLTDEFCQCFADQVNEAASEVDELVDAEYGWQRSFLRAEFSLPDEDE